jgi:hypothetical protein
VRKVDVSTHGLVFLNASIASALTFALIAL